jgi:hypothetical protein
VVKWVKKNSAELDEVLMTRWAVDEDVLLVSGSAFQVEETEGEDHHVCHTDPFMTV